MERSDWPTVGSNEEVVELGHGADNLGLEHGCQLSQKHHSVLHGECLGIRMSCRDGVAWFIGYVSWDVQFNPECFRVAVPSNGNRLQSSSWDVDGYIIIGSSTHEGVDVTVQVCLGYHTSWVAAWKVEDGDVAWVIFEHRGKNNGRLQESWDRCWSNC